MLPDFGVRIPARQDNKVVLPQPLGPSSRTSSPEWASALEAVQRTHDVVTAGELHGQIADRK
jgi:hypothetical protein